MYRPGIRLTYALLLIQQPSVALPLLGHVRFFKIFDVLFAEFDLAGFDSLIPNKVSVRRDHALVGLGRIRIRLVGGRWLGTRSTS